ncbi:MAG: flagellar biosynthetic protein FliO [Polyangiaceae bacterium]|nr:flagellar biosynthetic protein FliO [Polyangiaceae bacterium]
MSGVATAVEIALLLVAVAALAWVSWAARARGRTDDGALELVARLPLEPRRAVYLVRVVDVVHVLAASEQGLQKLGELDAAKLPPPAPRPRPTLRDLWGGRA